MSIIRMHNGERCTAKKMYNNVAGEFKEVKRVLRKGADGVFKEVYFLCVPNTVEGNVVQCYPWPKSELGLKVYFEPVEVLPAEGEKGPENPSTISGWDSVEVVRCGKNLANLHIGVASYGSGFANTVVVCSGNNSYLSSLISIPHHSQQYTFSKNKIDDIFRSFYFDEYVDCSTPKITAKGGTYHHSATNVSLEIPSGMKRLLVVWTDEYGMESQKDLCVQIELGSTATTYEPYIGDTYTITLPDTFYGGYVDFARGVLVQEWYQYEIDESTLCVIPYADKMGVVIWPSASNPMPEAGQVTCFSSHFIAPNAWSTDWGTVQGGNFFGNFLPDGTVKFDTADDFKAWALQKAAEGHPVRVAYKMVNPIEHALTDLVPIKALSQTNRYTPQINTIFANTNGNIVVNYCKYNDITFEATDQSAALVTLGVEPAYDLASDAAALAALGVTA